MVEVDRGLKHGKTCWIPLSVFFKKKKKTPRDDLN